MINRQYSKIKKSCTKMKIKNPRNKIEKIITGKIAKIMPTSAPYRYPTCSSFMKRAVKVRPTTIIPVVEAAQRQIIGSYELVIPAIM